MSFSSFPVFSFTFFPNNVLTAFFVLALPVPRSATFERVLRVTLDTFKHQANNI